MKFIISKDSETDLILVEFITTLNSLQHESGKMKQFANYILQKLAEQFIYGWMNMYGFKLMEQITPKMIAEEIAKIRVKQWDEYDK